MCASCLEEVEQDKAAEKARKEEERSGALFPNGGQVLIVKDGLGGRKILERIEVKAGERVVQLKNQNEVFFEEA